MAKFHCDQVVSFEINYISFELGRSRAGPGSGARRARDPNPSQGSLDSGNLIFISEFKHLFRFLQLEQGLNLFHSG